MCSDAICLQPSQNSTALHQVSGKQLSLISVSCSAGWVSGCWISGCWVSECYACWRAWSLQSFRGSSSPSSTVSSETGLFCLIFDPIDYGLQQDLTLSLFPQIAFSFFHVSRIEKEAIYKEMYIYKDVFSISLWPRSFSHSPICFSQSTGNVEGKELGHGDSSPSGREEGQEQTGRAGEQCSREQWDLLLPVLRGWGGNQAGSSSDFCLLCS